MVAEIEAKRKLNILQIEKQGDIGWCICPLKGEEKGQNLYPTKKEAITAARNLYPGKILIIKDANGAIKDVRGLQPSNKGLLLRQKSTLDTKAVNLAIANVLTR